VDLIFPHHEDEIAQSCAFTGREHFARYWMHGEFLQIRGGKMSKRFGNVTTARDLREDGVDPGAVRLLVFQTHYRQSLDFTDDGLAAAREGARRLGEFKERLGRATVQDGRSDEAEAVAARLRAEVTTALDDDLNGPQAVAALFDFVRDANRLLDAGLGADALRGAWRWADDILDVAGSSGRVRADVGAGLEFGETPPVGEEEPWAVWWSQRRVEAKKARDFQLADRIRDRLREHGFEIRDSKAGSEVVRTGS
jgi:cysteinyl-tRNA synthetase